MRKKMIEITLSIISLLRSCNQEEKAFWFEGKLKTIKETKLDIGEYKKELKEIREKIAGIGSFTDLALVPKQESRITKDQARQMQWDLAEQIDEIIGLLLKE